MLTRIVQFLLVLLAWPVQAAPLIQHWTTPYGTRVFFVETRELPIVDIQVAFAAGSSYDGKHPGLASLTANLLEEGAGGASANQISSRFESLGARYASGVSRDMASFSLRSLAAKDKLVPALDNLKQLIVHPDFPLDAIERKRQHTLLGIAQKEQSPGDLARDAFFAALYGAHPYAHPVEGTKVSVEQIGREDIMRFYRQYYVAGNAIVVLVGDLNTDQAGAIVDELMLSLPTGHAPAALPKVALLQSAQTLALPYPSTQTHILVGQPGVRRGDPDYFALYVGNHILGGSGMVSRLFEEIREKRGLSYTAYSYFIPLREAGPFLAGLQTQVGQATEALDLLLQNLRRFVKQGPTEAELLAAKKGITGGFPLRLDSNRKILGYVAMIGFYNLPLDYLETFNAKIEAITVDQIKAAFRSRVKPDRLVTVKVGQNKTDPGIEAL